MADEVNMGEDAVAFWYALFIAHTECASQKTECFLTQASWGFTSSFVLCHN